MKFECIDEYGFRLDINPAVLTTAQEKGVRIIKMHGKMMPMFYKKAKAVQNEKLIDLALMAHRKHCCFIQNDGDTAVELIITYYFPHTSGTPKWKQSQLTFMTQRPDADNISKALVDRMTNAGFWHDDSMVNFTFKKFRSPDPHIGIKIKVWHQSRENS